MYTEQVFFKSDLSLNPPLKSASHLDDFINLSFLSNTDSQLQAIAEKLEQSLINKKQIRWQLSELNNLSQEKQISINGQNYIKIEKPEHESLFQPSSLKIFNQEKYIKPQSIKSQIQVNQESLIQLNQNQEFLTLEIQSLISQRQQAIQLVSNIIAKSNENLLSVAKNF